MIVGQLSQSVQRETLLYMKYLKKNGRGGLGLSAQSAITQRIYKASSRFQMILRASLGAMGEPPVLRIELMRC